MDRLTKRCENENCVLKELEIFFVSGNNRTNGYNTCDLVCNTHVCNNCPIQRAFDKLAEYEDAEEQGLLLKLPFDVNSEVFIVSKQFILERNCTEYVVKKLKVREFRYNHLRNFVIICEEQMGDSIVQRHLYNANKIFLTKREAELELKRMEGAE